ncbi:three-helix bundle dimerization domain-containing protein [Terrabacter sp. NPDC080008]|uniref:three-helix bundle dimerization domain-containing protein n=1 Tax=Terrabacter sp. NPDC080008 TaxID=3155176 RepID=UPI00344BB476
MDSAAERKALAEVQARLEKRFPDLHPDVIAAAVRLAHSELVGPVRDFVPVLVEHAARDRLAFALREGDVLPKDTPVSSEPIDS